MEELVDVLDEKGMYTGKTETRANCNKLGIDLFKSLKDKEEENIKRTWK